MQDLISRNYRSLALLIPLAVVYGGFAAMPIAAIVELSLQNGFASFQKVLFSSIFLRILENTVYISILTTVISVLIGYLLAALLWQSTGGLRSVLIAIIVLPFWTAVLIKNFAWVIILGDAGVINDALQASGLTDSVVRLLYTRTAVVAGMVHYTLPYAVFSIYSSMVGIDRTLYRAAKSLGASSLPTFWLITVPLTLPGIYSAATLVFIISLGFYITPVILGGPREMMLANLVDIYVHSIVDFEAAAALSIVMLGMASAAIALYQALPREGQYGAN